MPSETPASEKVFVVLNNELPDLRESVLSQEEKIAMIQGIADENRNAFIEWAKGIDPTYDPDVDMGAFRNSLVSFPLTNAKIIEALQNGLPQCVKSTDDPKGYRIESAKKGESSDHANAGVKGEVGISLEDIRSMEFSDEKMSKTLSVLKQADEDFDDFIKTQLVERIDDDDVQVQIKDHLRKGNSAASDCMMGVGGFDAKSIEACIHLMESFAFKVESLTRLGLKQEIHELLGPDMVKYESRLEDMRERLRSVASVKEHAIQMLQALR